MTDTFIPTLRLRQLRTFSAPDRGALADSYAEGPQAYLVLQQWWTRTLAPRDGTLVGFGEWRDVEIVENE